MLRDARTAFLLRMFAVVVIAVSFD